MSAKNNPAMAGTNQEKPKKSFEFRMSKKVAELTQVVHMLFTRNHEKEVEIDALKKAYEKEIEMAIEDARGRISKLERTLEEQANQSNRARIIEMKNKDDEMKLKEIEWKNKLAESEKLLQEERCENQNLRDLLINAQGDIQKLRQGVTDELSSKSDEIRKRDKEMERLTNQLAVTEMELKRSQTDAQAIITELQRTNEKFEDDIHQLHGVIDNGNKTRDQLLNRNKQLEHDMKALKREFNRKAAEMSNNGLLKNPKNNLSAETNLELERLRREVQRYRLELSNRDNNFNRMFTDKQPVLLNQRNGPNSKQMSSAIYTSFPSHRDAPNQNNLASLQSQNGNGNSNLSLNHNVPNSILKDRQNTRASLLDMDRHNDNNNNSNNNSNNNNVNIFERRGNNTLDRQATFTERISSGERLLQNGHKDDNPRPQTHGSPFTHERTLANGNGKERNQTKPQLALFGQEQPHQILPQINTSTTGSIATTKESEDDDDNDSRQREMNIGKRRLVSKKKKKRRE